ncbi:NO-inducible flavohemoprotein [Acetobacter conturbans]|uniref:nitric oxide dioxygenase n=1 Tax=Acetobacter conturbans TaxID=1737472 RepID=A0ABX0K132_9PROT|nr:NO-inducible flavohemoprotein [Acetobacter conturbans]NHN88408.1 NO-inducible flavohemoprotein [Acetobacter conturbans]
MTAPLDEKTRSIVKACVPALEAHGLDITKEMYQRLLADPEIRDLFNMSHQKDGEQPKALALAVLAYARNIDTLGNLGGMVERITQKHVGLNILPEHYPYVGKALLGAIEHVLGDAATPEIMDAWAKAYWFLADVLIGREKQIYDEHEEAPGGWTGWRTFRVRSVKQESSIIRSFELVPTNGNPVMKHLPGQYLSFKLEIPGHGPERRNYSISSAPSPEHYRISVRKEDGGVVSSWFHDTVQEGTELQVSAPAGDFVYDPTKEQKTVFLSAGIGLTPFISAVEALSSDEKKSVRFIHGAHTAGTEAFGADVRKLAKSGVLQADIFFSTGVPESAAVQSGVRYHAGRISKAWLATQIDPDTIYRICGPDQFMRDMVETLKAAGVPAAQLRYEFFGSAADADLLAAI